MAHRRLDTLLAALAAAALIVDGALRSESGGLSVAGSLLAVLACAPLVWRRDAPLAVLIAVFCGVLATLAVLHPYNTAVFAVMIALYTVALLGGRRRSMVVGAGTAVVLVVVIVLVQQDEGFVGATVLRLVLALGALVVGDLVRSRRALAVARAHAVAHEARERESESRRRVEAERLRIARELHDTIAHALVAINVRSGVAAHLGVEHDRGAALAEIKDVSAEALRDLRATLSLLRQEGEAAPTGPTQDLDSVARLVERARAAGIDATAELDLGDTAIPSAVGQAGFRIVQESLTNVMRHAAASTARIRLQVVGDGLDIDVVDDGRGGVANGGGIGLQGMAERAGALGGRLDAGPGEAGGWRVHVHLPLADGR
ncbi:MAG TPA: histidine kinase [Solirubrobacter sp.]